MNNSILDLLKREDNSSEYLTGGGVSDADIVEAEKTLGVSIRGSYRKFLSEVGWLDLDGTYIFGLRRLDDTDKEGNVLSMTNYSRTTWHLPRHLIPFYSSEDEVLWCLDTSSNNEDPPIVAYSTKRMKISGKVSSSFFYCICDYLDLSPN